MLEGFAVSTRAISVQQMGAQTGISTIDALNYILTLTEQWLSIPNANSYYHNP